LRGLSCVDRNDPRDSQSLSQAVSKIIDDMHADGTLSSLSKKWYKGVDWTVTSASKGSASPSA
jgi:ABC-type amino acid transport substrate-binding protein